MHESPSSARVRACVSGPFLAASSLPRPGARQGARHAWGQLLCRAALRLLAEALIAAPLCRRGCVRVLARHFFRRMLYTALGGVRQCGHELLSDR